MKLKSIVLPSILAALLMCGLANAEPFSMIISSDTQYPWTNCTDGDCDESQADKEARAYQLNMDQRDAMMSLASARGDVIGIIINGDLTAYGHPKELKKYKEIWHDVELPLYEGLGNHDYLNNVDDTWLNQAANGMIDYMVKRLDRVLKVDADVTIKSGFMSKTTTGSLSYSWDVGNVHFVQLQNFPIYEREWSTFVWTKLTTKTYVIENSLDWLEADLAKATAEGKAIILNMHDTDEHWLEEDGGFESASRTDREALKSRFSDILARYPATAIFAGHYHKLVGELPLWDRVPNMQGAPVLFSGSTSQSLFLLAEFTDDQLIVRSFSSAGGAATPLGGEWSYPLYPVSAEN